MTDSDCAGLPPALPIVISALVLCALWFVVAVVWCSSFGVRRLVFAVCAFVRSCVRSCVRAFVRAFVCGCLWLFVLLNCETVNLLMLLLLLLWCFVRHGFFCGVLSMCGFAVPPLCCLPTLLMAVPSATFLLLSVCSLATAASSVCCVTVLFSRKNRNNSSIFDTFRCVPLALCAHVS